MKLIKTTIGVFLLAGVVLGQTGTANGLSIPTGHPRLWWTAERLAQARAWHATNPFTPRNDDYVGQAFRYLMTGETQYARRAIRYALGVTLSDSGATTGGSAGVSDGARWYGENVILIYDWCYDQMTASERQTLLDRWNTYL